MHEIIGVYLPVTVGIISQLVFLILPIELKNWRDDSLNALTYIGAQLAVACVVFIVVPVTYGLFKLNTFSSVLLLSAIFVAALLRCVKTIPLEGTSAIVKVLPPTSLVNFKEFYDKARLLGLAELNTHEPSDVRRIVAIKERIRKRLSDNRARSSMARNG